MLKSFSLQMISQLMCVFCFPTDVILSLSFALMVASLLATLFVTNLYYRSSHFGPVPHWLHTLMLKYAVILVFLPSNKRTNRITVSLPEYTKGMIIACSVYMVTNPGFILLS